RDRGGGGMRTEQEPSVGRLVPTEASARLRKVSRRSKIQAQVGVPAGIGIACVIGVLTSDNFLTVGNLMNVLINVSVLGVIAVGMTFVFITRGLADLSVPANVAVGAILVLALQPQLGTAGAAAVGLVAAGLAGTISGVLIGYGGINPVITTLALNTIVLGFVQWAVGGVIVYGSDTSAQNALNSRVLGVPVIVIILVAVAAIGHLLLSRTILGRWTYATGGNPHATRASAAPVAFTKATAFAMTGLHSGLAGVLLGI